MNSFSRLTWKCHVCGELRPDALVGVRSREITVGGIPAQVGGIPAQENVRYCLDKPECVEGSKHVRWFDKDPES